MESKLNKTRGKSQEEKASIFHRSRKWKYNSQFAYRNRDFLMREYVINKKPCTVIAKEQHTQYKQILYWLHKFEIPIHPRFEYCRVNLKGNRYGHLVVLREFTDESSEFPADKGVRWVCKCDCGREIITYGRLLNKGDKESCGKHRFKGYKEISGRFFNRIKRGAAVRNIDFHLTLEEIWSLFLKQNRTCALSGVKLSLDIDPNNVRCTASLDRIDSSKGYFPENVQWVHKDVNRFKWQLDETTFLDWVQKIYHYRVKETPAISRRGS